MSKCDVLLVFDNFFSWFSRDFGRFSKQDIVVFFSLLKSFLLIHNFSFLSTGVFPLLSFTVWPANCNCMSSKWFQILLIWPRMNSNCFFVFFCFQLVSAFWYLLCLFFKVGMHLFSFSLPAFDSLETVHSALVCSACNRQLHLCGEGQNFHNVYLD